MTSLLDADRDSGAESGVEADAGPAGGLAGEEKAVVEAVRAVHPELDALGREAVAAPVGRAGNLSGVLQVEEADLLFKQRPGGEDAALLRDGGADLAAARAGVEVGVCFLVTERRDGALDADLAAQSFPVEAEGGLGILGELGAFAALGVGEKAEAALVDALDQYHADRGDAVEGRGGERGGVGVVGLGLLSFLKP